MRYAGILLLTVFFLGCAESPIDFYQPTESVSETFGDYWFDGKAELATYAVQQSRYGQIREGEAVLITVTEPFNGKLQVKANSSSTTNYNVLKTNFIKRFTTGIYDYSAMTSTFVPLNTKEHQPAAKVTTSIQDWCGQAYSQMNRVDGGYHFRLHSYFEQEVLETHRLQPQLLMDEVFALIRMSPELLPTGAVQLTRSSELTRYRHQDIAPIGVNASMETDSSLTTFTLENAQERYVWQFRSAFPHTIVGWKEMQLDGQGNPITKSVTSATLKTTMRTPYWSQNGNEYEYLRDSLHIGR